MSSLLDLLNGYVFSGIPSNAAWDFIKAVWEKLNERSWEELYFDAFRAALADERERLSKYSDGEVRLDTSALRRALHHDLAIAVETMPLSELTDGQFAQELSAAMVEHDVLLIAGHSLDEEDYAQLVRNLVRRATALFKRWIIQNEDAFQQAMVAEALANKELMREVRSLLLDSFDVSLERLEQIQAEVDRLSQSITSPKNFLTHADFAVRSEKLALASYDLDLVGRSSILDQIEAFLSGQARLLILHGPGGVGKTRLLLALPDIVEEPSYIWYVRTEAESIESDLASLDRDQQHVLVVDDAHRFAALPHMREALSDPGFAHGIKIILSTRSIFSESVSFSFPQISGDLITEIEIPFLTNADIDNILRKSPYEIGDDEARRSLVVVAEGNPLIAQVAANLLARGADIRGLGRDEVIARYFDEILHDLARAGYDENCASFLEILAALGILDLNNDQLHQRVLQSMSASGAELEQTVELLARAGLVERYWNTVKLASEVLADHILVNRFFGSPAGVAKYREGILEPFFDLKPKEILTNLAKAEMQGESVRAGVLLEGKLEEIRRIVEDGGNIERLAVIEWLQDVAYFRPEDALTIVAPIVDGSELPPEIHSDGWLGPIELDHELVLLQAIDVIKQTIYRGGLRDAALYLHKLARFRSGSAEYKRVREKARGALKGIAGFEPNKPLDVQLILLSLMSSWLEDDSDGSLDLVVSLTSPMLAMELSSLAADPTELFRIISQRGMLNPVEPLRIIRERSLGILYDAYSRTSTILERVRIVHALNGTVPLHYRTLSERAGI